MKKDVKLYNVIFPIWLLVFFPPIILITLAGNFLIDSLVIVLCYYVFKLSQTQDNLKVFYKSSILKVWMFGFLSDAIGGVILFSLGILNIFSLPYELISAVNFDPFSEPLAVAIILVSMLISGILIFIFNYKYTFSKLVGDKILRMKVSLAIAVITIPWTFLLPTKWFY